MKEEFELIAKTFQGLEEVLAKELTELGASNIEIGRRMVAFMGDKEMMYKANFCLRTETYTTTPKPTMTAQSLALADRQKPSNSTAFCCFCSLPKFTVITLWTT